MANNEFPRFIQNRPNGLDKFEGASQTKLAKAIAQQIVNNDALPKEEALPKIIGIQGEWGAGKTNVVRLLEKELSGKYYFFEYDAWGHQEDLQRRSILELLTDKLIEEARHCEEIAKQNSLPSVTLRTVRDICDVPAVRRRHSPFGIPRYVSRYSRWFQPFEAMIYHFLPWLGALYF